MKEYRTVTNNSVHKFNSILELVVCILSVSDKLMCSLNIYCKRYDNHNNY